jgi:hypothetical protein
MWQIQLTQSFQKMAVQLLDGSRYQAGLQTNKSNQIGGLIWFDLDIKIGDLIWFDLIWIDLDLIWISG